MLRFQFKDDSLLGKAVIYAISQGWQMRCSNSEGNCLFFWIDGSREAMIHHWTSGIEFIEINSTNYLWYKQAIKEGDKPDV